jgi:hypothetical protein
MSAAALMHLGLRAAYAALDRPTTLESRTQVRRGDSINETIPGGVLARAPGEGVEKLLKTQSPANSIHV